MRLLKLGVVAAVLGMALGLVSCQQKPQAINAVAADAWAKVLVGHTSGIVSRKSAVHVLFSADIAAAAPLTNATLEISPTTPGTLALNGARELVFTPAAQLKPGQTYAVTLTGKGLTGLPAGLAPYRFEFNVQTPQYELVLSELESDASDDRLMNLRGTIMTADQENAPTVEQMLKVTYGGSALVPTWSHAGDGREHSFTLARLTRQEVASAVQLNAVGKPIGSSRDEQREISVPAVSAFSVVNVQALEDNGRKQVQVTFSDALDERQNLKGLVQFSGGEFTSSVEGNRLVVFPSEEATGDVSVTLEAGIRNARGKTLAAQSVHSVALTSQKPQVRFVGNGVILPDAKTLTVPFEAVSARSVQVTATEVFVDNIPQFLQVNALGGNDEIGRVGRYLWRKKLVLSAPSTGRWQRYEIDVTELVRAHPNALLQLRLQLTPADSAYACSGEPAVGKLTGEQAALTDQEDSDSGMQANWDYSEEYFGVSADEAEGDEDDYERRWNERKDPCKNAYYFYGYSENVQAQRNLIASNLGLLAKADARGQLLVSVTNLGTARSWHGYAEPRGCAVPPGSGIRWASWLSKAQR
jgi:alpha-2-macroglobulin